MHIYHKSRYRARKKYYDKEENKEKKRIYMRAYNKRPKKDFLEEAEKEKKELEASYQESLRQTKERKNFHPKAIDGYGE